jgi:sugar/nucleoside kinase (ribokinase family)
MVSTTAMRDSADRVLVVGDVIDDIQVKITQSPRPDTDTPAEIHRNQGGSAANTAVWLAQAGVGVDFFGRVGIADAQRMTDVLVAAGVNPLLQRDPDRETGAIVMIVEGEVRTMLSDRGANTALDVVDVPESLLGSSSWLHLTGYSLFHHEHPDTITHLIARATSAGASVMVDASSAGFLEDFGVARFLECVEGVTILRCNKDEALVLASTDDIDSAALELARRFATVVITQGPAGSLVCEGSDITRIPAVPPVRLVDPTGAGDAFNAGLLSGLIDGLSVEQAALRASEIAARAVTNWGARPSMP